MIWQQQGNTDCFVCELCENGADLVIHLCPINEHLEGLFEQKKGMILFYVISICEKHVGNNWVVFKHRGLDAFRGQDKDMVLAKFRKYTEAEIGNSCGLHNHSTIEEGVNRFVRQTDYQA